MRHLGIDFGTSNTVAIVGLPDGRVRPLLFDGSPLLPSAIYLGTDGRMLIGRDAERNARVDPSRFEPNPKRRIDDGEIFLGDRPIPVPTAISIVLQQVVAEAKRQLGGGATEIRMTHPARWGEKRRSLLLEAARLVGLPQPTLLAEPVAAASYFTSVLGTAVAEGRCLAIYDLGGGTFDATVVRRRGTGFEVLAEGGIDDIGGLDFDHGIIEHLGKTYSHINPEVWQRLVSPVEGSDRRYRRMLYEDVRGAKEMLSRASQASIHLPALEIDAHITRDELEELIRPYLERTVRCLATTIEDARLAPSDLVGIFLVGGSSRIPLAAQLIHTQLNVAPTTLEQPETVVAEGSLRADARSLTSGHPGNLPNNPVRSTAPTTLTPPTPSPSVTSGGPTPGMAIPQRPLNAGAQTSAAPHRLAPPVRPPAPFAHQVSSPPMSASPYQRPGFTPEPSWWRKPSGVALIALVLLLLATLVVLLAIVAK